MTEVILVRGTRHEVHECLTCGCIIVASERVLEHMREHGGFYHCQNGHKQGWTVGGSEIEKLRRERDRLKQEQARLVEEREAADRSATRARADLKRHQKRSAAGTCPCCQRTFANMATHMKRQHPEFVASNVVKLGARA